MMKEMLGIGEAAFPLRVLCCVAVASFAAFGRAGECDVAKSELAKYWQAVTGRTDAPVELAVEPSVSASGNDAYVIRSEKVEGWKGGGARYGVKITGSNGRSVLYGVYDLLERRGGCGWFWDGDRVPKKEKIDLSGLDVREESKFAYRGIRYFAHRGLTRFQAEHWGFDDWKREIDWCLKKRLNLFMLRIGQDDYFQKAFPDVCAYPDASKPLPGQHERYDNRSLFWPLEFRGELRKKVMEYAFARGMMAPEDFGTMTHWYSRTPQDFLDKMKPDFLPQAPGAYGEPSGLVWDIRQQKWMDAYWKLTDTGIREYGRPGLLHTIGIAERRISTNRLENLKMKTEWTNMLLTEAKTRHPESVRLLAGWDFYCMKTPDEVKNFLKGIPEDVVIWDYEADASINTWFGEWDIVGKRPYAFGVFMAYEAGLDPRTDYAKIAARQKLVENDPMCKGYILWPESSHVDSMGLEWFAKNSWRADAGAVEPVVADYCARRYPDEAAAMRELWMKTIPVSTNMQNTWRWNAFLPILREMNEGLVSTNECDRWPAPKPDAFFADLPKVIATLKELDWGKDELLKRDMTDLARVWADRLAVEAENRLFTAYFRWIGGDESAAEDVCRNGALAVARLNALAELLALHEDFSICDTYDHLRAIHPVALPTFSSVLVDNVANYYCTSHQAELARHCYIPAFEHYLDILKKRMLANDRTPPEKKCLDAYRTRAMKMGFDELRLMAPRTRESFNAALDRILAAFAPKEHRPFIPVFSAGKEQGGGSCKFPELSVFRDGIPAYSVNSAMKPNPRPFSKNREYPKKYVRRIEGKERRTTPYRFEEMFANPAASIDSEYARSGKPFFVYERMSRPPYFLPTDGCPLAIRESYEAWKKAHPGFIAFNSLWELDSDSNYFENFYDRMGDESIAAELHAAFGPPDAKGRAHRVRWAEKIFRIGADFHFGETAVYPLCSGNPGYEHIFGAMGAKGLWYEATTQSMGPWNAASAFLRGAARQRGLDYGWYMAHYMTGWTRDGKLVKGHNQRAYGYEGLLSEPHPNRGESRSLFRRKALFGWMIGAKYLMCEAWSHLFIDRVDGRDVPSDSARDFNEIYELSKATDRGEPFTPLAVLTPLAEPCNVNYQHDKLLDPKTQTEIFNTLVPFLGADGKPSVSRKAGDQGCLFNSEFANAFDVLCPDSGQDSAAFAKVLSRYRHVLIAGEAFDKAKFDTAAIAAFENAGGKVHRYPSPECDTPEKLRALLLSIQDETMPVKVEGDVQWGVNFVEGQRSKVKGQTAEGKDHCLTSDLEPRTSHWLVYLINNKGVIKYCDEPEEFDETKVAHVTVTVKATGETFVRDVKPGDFCLLSLGGK